MESAPLARMAAPPQPSRWAWWRVVFTLWTLVGTFTVVEGCVSRLLRGRPLAPWRDLIIPQTNVWLWALLTPSIFWLARRLPLERGAWKRNAALHVLLGLGYAAVSSGFDSLLAFVLGVTDDFTFFQAYSFAAFINVQGYFVTMFIAQGLRYHEQLHERRLRASELESQLWQTRLQALEMQLRPHFFFNSLHSVASLIRAGSSKEAVRMIGGIGDLMRAVLRRDGAQEVPLRQELELVEQYLAIERIRFQDRLEVRLDVEAEALDARVPHFILQPLVENAIRHGIEASEGRGRVELSISRAGDSLRLRVRDTGTGPTAKQLAEGGRGVGLSNTRARLQHLYGSNYRFELGHAEGGGALVSVDLPFRPVVTEATEEDAARPREALLP
ncbi:sensor histidine kinase [Pyxidicoccus parkwayensis]|uniref:histidine kinase n=1 Tax=Pyxidicoccus parkwayensis TaxID=2813578 RepID=A0ABX7PBC5_9BACT|nr:sensor histidine kinase [Pyxidicoccus parkwaysis]QSQ27690.1 sensor histidine kinase [Pyxidicoccus parkwaysis]